MVDYQYYYSTASSCLPEVATSMSKDFHDLWWKSEKYLEDRNKYKDLCVNPSSALKIAIASYLEELSKGKTLEEIIVEYPAEKVLLYVPFMNRSLIDQNVLKDFLIKNINMIKSQIHPSNYKKLVCFYDNLVYRWD